MSMPQVLAEGLFAKLPVLVNDDICAGKTYIVTGGNHGLGLETARHLVRSSAARVILTVRNMKAGEYAKDDIERATGRTGIVELWDLNLASYDSIKAFATKLSHENVRIDGFIANAGVQMDRWETAEGMELSMQVNVVSTILLAVLIIPKLVESAQSYGNEPKLVFVGSALGFVAKEDLAKCGKADVFAALNEHKRANMDQRSPAYSPFQSEALSNFDFLQVCSYQARSALRHSRTRQSMSRGTHRRHHQCSRTGAVFDRPGL